MGTIETIAGLAAKTGIPASTIRMYQHIGILDPPRREGRLGIYDTKHVRRIETILRLKDMGFSLSGIRTLLDAEARERVLEHVIERESKPERPKSKRTGLALVLAALDDEESPLQQLLDYPDDDLGAPALSDSDVERLAEQIDVPPGVIKEEIAYLRETVEDLAEHYLKAILRESEEDANPNDEAERIAFWIVFLRRAISFSFDRAIRRRIEEQVGRLPAD